METARFDFGLGIGGAAGQGIATPGNILARLLVRRGLHVNAYTAYQSVIRGGHVFLTIRISDRPVGNHGDKIDLLLCLNQDTLNRHLPLMGPGSRVIYNSDAVRVPEAGESVHLCSLPVVEITGGNRNRLVQNTVALGSIVSLLGLDFGVLEDTLELPFGRKGQSIVDENVGAARAGFEYANANFTPFPEPAPVGATPLALWTGKQALAMGGAAAGVSFYCSYPTNPATGLHNWLAEHAYDLQIAVLQLEDDVAAVNNAIGAAHVGCRAMCASSGGGFAMMADALASAGMMETTMVVINVQRGGPGTGLPTKTAQDDLRQALGAGQGDFERFIVAPLNALDTFNAISQLFNLCDKCQCPGILLSDLLLAESMSSVNPADIDVYPKIDRGELFLTPLDSHRGGHLSYKRYRDTESGISPRAVPGLEGFVHVVATDEHDEDGTLISDEFTNPHKRRRIVEKRARKVERASHLIDPPQLQGPKEAEVTLIGWGSTYGPSFRPNLRMCSASQSVSKSRIVRKEC